MNVLLWLRRNLRNWLFRPQRPGPMYVVMGESSMGNALRVTVALPPLAEGEAGEVVKRQLTRIINSGEPVVTELGADQADFQFDVQQDDAVNLSLVNIDDAGNVSAPSIRDFVALDTVPPAAPGEISVSVAEVPA